MNEKGKVFPDINKLEEVYVQRLEKGNQQDQTNVEYPETQESAVYGRFDKEEVIACLNEFVRTTAAGTDNIKVPDMKKLPPGHITAIMNLWWGWKIPKEAEQCRTTLLPKKEENLEDVGNWRPITVGNLFMRLYAKLWNKRLRKNTELDEWQKGFVPVDGCFENVKILQEAIKQQKQKKREYNIVFVDLAKAFDTVSHRSIEKGLRRKGVPTQVVDTIMSMYEHATTRITVGGKTNRAIKINAGVRQGCPLSPLLFSLILDELITKVKVLNVGITLGNQKVCIMAFADDLVLLTEDKFHMQILIEETKEFLDQKGLTANAKKCASLRVVPVKGKQSMKVVTSTHRKWGNEGIPSITFKDLVRYLGINLKPDGSMELPRKLWIQYLDKAQLNPIQKVDAIRTIIAAKIQYQLRLSDHGLEEARKLTRILRKFVKKILHLPTWTSTSWIHHRHGCNIPDLTTTVMSSRTKASTMVSEDNAAQFAGERINPTNEERLIKLNLLQYGNKKEEIMKRYEQDIITQNNGRARLTMINSRHKRSWLWNERGLKPGNKLRLIQALSGTLPTMVNKTRGRDNLEEKKCKRCKSGATEDDAHILASCKYNKDLITKRHDYVAKKIAKELVQKNPAAKIWREHSWRYGNEIVRPDITMVNGNECTIIEVTIPYETSNEYIHQRRDQKIEMYKKLIKDELTQVECISGQIIPFVIGALGTITTHTNQDLKKLKLSSIKDALQMTVATGSINILNSHFRRNDFEQG